MSQSSTSALFFILLNEMEFGRGEARFEEWAEIPFGNSATESMLEIGQDEYTEHRLSTKVNSKILPIEAMRYLRIVDVVFVCTGTSADKPWRNTHQVPK